MPRLGHLAGEPLEVGRGRGRGAGRDDAAAGDDEQAREQPEPGEEVGHGREAITDGRGPAAERPIRARADRSSVRGPGAWPRGGGPSCRPRRSRRSELAAGAGAGGPSGPASGRRRVVAGATGRGSAAGSPTGVGWSPIGADGRQPHRRASADRVRRARPAPARASRLVVRRRPGADAAQRRPPALVSQAPAAANSRRPTDTRRRAMSSGHRSSARIEEQRPQFREPICCGQVVDPRVLRRSDDFVSAGRGAQRSEERLVRRRGAGLGRRSERRARRSARAVKRPGRVLGHPHRVGARFDLAEGRLVHARCGLDQVDGSLRFEEPRDDDRARRVEVARRPIGLDALDVERGLPADRLEGRLDAPGLLAREGPAHELVEEAVEAWLQPTQSFAHRPVASDCLHAQGPARARTAIAARGGSSRAVTSTPWAADFKVVPL